MLSMEDLGYFLYMEQCDRDYEQEQREKAAAALRQYQVDTESLLETDRGTPNENRGRF